MPNHPAFVELLGWTATAVFILSYFCRSAAALRSFQMAGAVLWIVYGTVIDALPVIVANILVFSAAAWTVLRARRAALHAEITSTAETG